MATIILAAYGLHVNSSYPGGYNYWAVLAMDVFLLLSWTGACATFAAMAGLLFAPHPTSMMTFAVLLAISAFSLVER